MAEISILVSKKQEPHPISLFISFLSILIINVFIPHPLIVAISLMTSFILMIYLKQMTIHSFIRYLIFYLLIALTNPLFVLKGKTVLFYISTLPYTLEALIYGIVFAGMILSILWWCQIFHTFITGDHVVYLFSHPFSSLGMILAVLFQLIDKFKRKYQEIRLYSKKYEHRFSYKLHLEQWLTLFTWAFESSIDMVDSMSARGYSRHRSHFHLFIFRSKDKQQCLLMIGIDILLLFFYKYVYRHFYYYPVLKPISFDLFSILCFIAFFIMCLIPISFIQGEKKDV